MKKIKIISGIVAAYRDQLGNEIRDSYTYFIFAMEMDFVWFNGKVCTFFGRDEEDYCIA